MTPREQMLWECGRLKGHVQSKMISARGSTDRCLRGHFVKWAKDYHRQYLAAVRRVRESYE